MKLGALNKTNFVYGLKKQNNLRYVKLLDHTELLSEFSELDISNLNALTFTLENDQLNTKILIQILRSSTCTCFDQYLAHSQEVKLY